MDKPKRIVLIGMMGSGKTTIGRLLADRTGWPFIDNDQLLEQVTGKTARDIAQLGEPALRQAETAALSVALESREPAIIGAAAGSILDPANRRAIAATGTVVWLRARPATLAARTQGGSPRPWLAGDALAWLTEVGRRRDPLYAVIADLIVDVDDITATDAATLIRDRVPATAEPQAEPALDSR